MAFYELEQRIFYDAALPADAGEAGGDNSAEDQSEDNQPDASEQDNANNADTQESGGSTENEGEDTPSDDEESTDEVVVDDDDKVVVDDPEEFNHFGDTVAMDDDYVVVGATDADGQGAVYIFKKEGDSWIMVQKITASDGQAGDNFGSDVAICDGTIIVGADGVDDNGQDSGAIYVFKNDGDLFTEDAKITAIDGAAGDNFGDSVSIDGDYLVVGAAGDDDLGEDSGSAYVYQMDPDGTWNEQAKIYAGDGEANSFFGDDVAIDDCYIVVGASGDDGHGSAYIFECYGDTWFEQAKITGTDTESGDHFGSAVDIDSNQILIGAWGDDDHGEDSGAAYVFFRDGNEWSQDAKINASDADIGDHFGYDVDIDDGHIIVGAPGRDSNTGAAYTYNYSDGTWSEHSIITSAYGQAGDSLGTAVALNGDFVLIGAPGTDDGEGAAYVIKYDKPGPTPDPDDDDSGDDGTPPDINDLDDTNELDPLDDSDDYDEEQEQEEEEEDDFNPDNDNQDGDSDNNTPNGPGIHGGDGVYNFGMIGPPGSSETLINSETSGVDFFDVANMRTAYNVPNGEYQSGQDPTGPGNVFKHVSHQQGPVVSDDDVPDGAVAAERTATNSDFAAIQGAEQIVQGFIDSGDPDVNDSLDYQLDSSERAPLGNMIQQLFLSDMDLDGDIDGDDAGQPDDYKHPSFKDSLDKSIDALFDF